MTKDLLIAIILGGTLGFLATTGFYNVTKNNQKITPTPTPTFAVSPTPKEEPEKIGSFSSPSVDPNLNIESPLNESISSKSEITVKGTSKPNNILIINTPVKTYTSTISEDGSFSVNVEIESGANIIKISAIDSNDNQTNAELLVTYSTAKF